MDRPQQAARVVLVAFHQMIGGHLRQIDERFAPCQATLGEPFLNRPRTALSPVVAEVETSDQQVHRALFQSM